MAPYHGRALYCIGGPLDGKQRTILHGHTMEVFDREPMAVTDPGAGRVPPMVCYDPREVQFDGARAWFWVLHDLDPDEALRKIEGLLRASAADL